MVFATLCDKLIYVPKTAKEPFELLKELVRAKRISWQLLPEKSLKRADAGEANLFSASQQRMNSESCGCKLTKPKQLDYVESVTVIRVAKIRRHENS